MIKVGEGGSDSGGGISLKNVRLMFSDAYGISNSHP